MEKVRSDAIRLAAKAAAAAKSAGAAPLVLLERIAGLARRTTGHRRRCGAGQSDICHHDVAFFQSIQNLRYGTIRNTQMYEDRDR